MASDDTSVTALAGVFARRAALLACVYTVGAWRLSPAWLLAPLALSVLREKWRRRKRVRQRLTQAMAGIGEQAVLVRLQDMPSWVHFPDVERAEWLNKMVHQIWPFLGEFLIGQLKDVWEQQLRQTLANYRLNNFRFNTIHLGDIPLRFGGVKVYSENVQRSEIILDLEIFYAGNCKIDCSFGSFSAGIQDLSLHGTVRLVFRPLIKTMPLIGAIQVFFLSTPALDFNMLGVADVLDIPGLSGVVRSAVIDTINALIVLPNKWPIILSDCVDAGSASSSLPRGVLRVNVIEARNLIRKDKNIFGGGGKSDPYAVIRVGVTKHTTKHINDTLDPVWNYIFEVELAELQGARLDIELWDWDKGVLDKDEQLGRCSVDLSKIAVDSWQDLWLPLEDVPSGSVHITLDWLNVSTQADHLPLQLEQIAALRNDGDQQLHAAVLTVLVDSADQLPMVRRSSVEPSACVHLSVGHSRHSTVSKADTRRPVWEESFTFLVADPRQQTLSVEIEDQKTNSVLGTCHVSLSTLLSATNMRVAGAKYSLQGVARQSLLTLTLQLGILTGEEVPVPGSPAAPSTASSVEAKSVLSETGLSSSDSGSPNAADKAADQVSEDFVHVASLPSPAQLPSQPPTDTSPSESDKMVTPTGSPSAAHEPQKHQSSETVEEAKPDTTISGDLSGNVGSEETVLRKRHSVYRSGTLAQLGRIEVSLKLLVSATATATLTIGVHQISGLPIRSANDIPDPYVKLYLLPDRSEKNKRKTKTLTDSCDPVYNEFFEYSVSRDTVASRSLEIQVVSKKNFSRSPVIGVLLIDLSLADLKSGERVWYDLKPATAS